MTPGQTFEALWSVRDVAAFLKMSVSWVYKAAERGELPSLRIGAALRFHPEEIRKFLARLSRAAATVTTLRPGVDP